MIKLPQVKIEFLLLLLIVPLIWLLYPFDEASDLELQQQPSTSSQRTELKTEKLVTPFSQHGGTTNNDSGDQELQAKLDSGNIDAIDSDFISNVSAHELINAYMSAWSGNDRHEIDRTWHKITQCRECLRIIKDMMLNQSVPKGMLLELTHKIIKLGDPELLDVFDALIQPTVDLNTRIIVTQQMVKDGRSMYVEKLLYILQRADQDGYHDFAMKHIWAIAKLKNADGINTILDVISGRRQVDPEFATHVNSIFTKSTLVSSDDVTVAETLANYYSQADDQERQSLLAVVSLNPGALAALATDALNNGDDNDFKHFSETIAAHDTTSAMDKLFQLQGSVEYADDHFHTLIRQMAVRQNNTVSVHKLEDYLRNPQSSLQTKIMAAEGIMAVKHNPQARYVLEKILTSSDYNDADIVSYINAHL